MRSDDSGSTSTIDLQAVFGVSPDVGYVVLRCPAHDDRGRPNLVVYRDGSYCFVCGHRETPAELQARLAAHPEQAELVGRGRRQAEGNWEAAARLAARNLLEGRRRERLSWLLARGLTEETVIMAGLGHDGLRFTIPYRDGERIIGIKYRQDPAYGDDGPRYQNSPGLSAVYRPLPAGWPTVVTEGELDALLLAQYGVDAVTVSTGARGLARLRLPARGVIVACDWDEAGETAAAALLEARPGWVRLPRQGDGKDVTEWIVALPRLERGQRVRDALVGLTPQR